jgi:hypothetical protein
MIASVVGTSGVDATATPMNTPVEFVVEMALVTLAAAASALAGSDAWIVAVTVIEPPEMLRVMSSAVTPFPAAAARAIV